MSNKVRLSRFRSLKLTKNRGHHRSHPCIPVQFGPLPLTVFFLFNFVVCSCISSFNLPYSCGVGVFSLVCVCFDVCFVVCDLADEVPTLTTCRTADCIEVMRAA